MLKMLGSLLLPLLILPTVVITTRPLTIVASGGSSCATNALCKKADPSDGFTCKAGGSQTYTSCELLGVHYERWAAEAVLSVHLLEELHKILEAVQPGQEAFEEVRGAIREINLRLQVGQNATSQLLAELDTLRGRQAVSAAVQVGQVLMFIGYLLTISVVYMVKHCQKHRERLANQEFELIEQKLQARKAKRRAAAAKAKAAPGPSQE